MRSVMKLCVLVAVAGLILLMPGQRAEAATRPLARSAVCGVAEPYGQETSHILYLYDAVSQYSYAYQFTVALWKDRCPLAYGVGSVHSFDSDAPGGTLSVSVFDCSTKTGGYTESSTTSGKDSITYVTSHTVPVGPYYFVQAYYADSSGRGLAVFQSGCIDTP